MRILFVLFSLALGQHSSPGPVSGSGTKPDCTADSDCTDGYCEAGKCIRYAQTGESCGGIMHPIGVCAPGLDCILPYNPDIVNLPGRCGRGCRTNTDCRSDMHCDIPTKNCLIYLDDGAPCEFGSTSVCAPGLTCSDGACTKGSASGGSSLDYSSGTYGSSSESLASGVSSRESATGPSSPPSMTGPSSPTGPSYPSNGHGWGPSTGPSSSSTPVATGPGYASSPAATGPSDSSSTPTGAGSGSSAVPSGPSYSSSAVPSYPSSGPGYPSSEYPSSPSSTSWGTKPGQNKHKRGCGGFVIGHDGSTGSQNGPDGAPSARTNCADDSDCTGKKFCDAETRTCMTYRELGESCGNAGTLTPFQCAPGLRCLAQRPMPGSPRICVNDDNVTCPPRLPALSCFTDPCNISACEGYPNATCVPDYCGGCNTKWSEGGQAVKCKTPDCPTDVECPKVPESCNTTMVPFGKCCPVCSDCDKVFCPATFCDNPVQKPGACCPLCPSNPGIPIPPPEDGEQSPINP